MASQYASSSEFFTVGNEVLKENNTAQFFTDAIETSELRVGGDLIAI